MAMAKVQMDDLSTLALTTFLLQGFDREERCLPSSMTATRAALRKLLT